MKKIVALATVAAVLALGACANKQAVDYGYEKQAPYAADRTVGTTHASKGDMVFQGKQKK